MDADYRFWSTVKWLMENEDAYAYVDSHERSTLKEALKQARSANRLTGIPTHAYGYVMGFWRSHWSECLDEGVRAEVRAMIEGRTVASLTASEIARLRSLIKSENFVG